MVTQPLSHHHLPFTPPALRDYAGPVSDPGYQIVPRRSAASHARPGWRLSLSQPGQPGLLALDLRGEATVGHRQGAGEIDVDLSSLECGSLGVSRQHLRLIPRPLGLLVMDLRSTNGSYVNGLPLRPHEAYPLANGDILSLGRLHLHIHLIAAPS